MTIPKAINPKLLGWSPKHSMQVQDQRSVVQRPERYPQAFYEIALNIFYDGWRVKVRVVDSLPSLRVHLFCAHLARVVPTTTSVSNNLRPSVTDKDWSAGLHRYHSLSVSGGINFEALMDGYYQKRQSPKWRCTLSSIVIDNVMGSESGRTGGTGKLAGDRW